jgi:hypothetical protein
VRRRDSYKSVAGKVEIRDFKKVTDQRSPQSTTQKKSKVK